MAFLGLYRAIYDYTPQADHELAIQQGDLLCILEKNDDDSWWKAKKKANADDEDEPTGLVPNNYVREAEPLSHARALYEYTRQTDEELSFSEDAILQVFDTSDPDWILVGQDGEYGFVPANYIEMQEILATGGATSPALPPNLPARPTEQQATAEPDDTSSNVIVPDTPASAIPHVMQSRETSLPSSIQSQPPKDPALHEGAQLSDEEPIGSRTLPPRPPEAHSTYQSPAIQTQETGSAKESFHESRRTPGVFHLYNINEMVTVMGKKKKMPTTLGINLGTGTILIAPEGGYPGPDQEWTADKMTHYSREGKHVFLELVRPSRSIDFHAGAKDTAEEIVAALGELAGAARAEGLREVIMAGSQKRDRKGTVLYDFMAQGEDEVTVAAGDDVIIIDDSRSEEWWQIRRLKNGKEGVVPSSYIELTGTLTPPSAQLPSRPANSNHVSAKSTVEQNRQEEIRLTKEAMKAGREPQQVGPGMRLPERGSSLVAMEHGNNSGQQRSLRDNGRNDRNGQVKPKAKPDTSKLRTWTDRSKSFSVEAQFLGIKDGKLHLHKVNGVKIAVPIAKMSREDLEYVEHLTGISLDDEKPLADVRKSKSTDPRPSGIGASIERSQSRPEYDWFQFFLSCDIAVGLCERYAQAFVKDSMDESVLPDVDPNVLRNLGFREGDIIKVMRSLDSKFGRDHGNKAVAEVEGGAGGLFSGPRGNLLNNTKKGRPTPTLRANDVVDATALSTKEVSPGSDEVKSPLTSLTKSPKAPPLAGFDDDAWDVKPSKKEQQQRVSQEAKKTVALAASADLVSKSTPATPSLPESMQELSLLTPSLQPSQAGPPTHQDAEADRGNAETSATASLQRIPGASPSFFASSAQMSPKSLARQRPTPPSGPLSTLSSLVPPPPQRPLSAPLTVAQQGMFPPPVLTPQLTGIVQGQVAPHGQSLHDLSQARLQQQRNAQLQQIHPMITGYSGFQPQGLAAFSTGSPAQFMQPIVVSSSGTSRFAGPGDPHHFSSIQPQATGFHSGLSQPMFSQPTPNNINSYLLPPLEPQRTGMSILQSQNVASNLNTNMQTPPLISQNTGPPPVVRFGVIKDANKLVVQPTSGRANLARATPQNPFGF